MIKIGFRLFGCGTVFFFLAFFCVYIAITTVPPVTPVSDKIISDIYAPSREHLREKYKRAFDSVHSGALRKKFVITEIEANAFFHHWATETFRPSNSQIIKNPYITINRDTIVIRFDLAFSDIFRLSAANAITPTSTGYDSAEQVFAPKAAKAKGAISRIRAKPVAMTIVARLMWVEKEKRPYAYVEKVYLGALPVPFVILSAHLQDNLNNAIWGGVRNFTNFLPFYVRGLNTADKQITVTYETKVDEMSSFLMRKERFLAKNPALKRAFDQKNCLYGCTQKEWDTLDDWMSSIGNKGVVSLDSQDQAYGEQVAAAMAKRRRERIESGKHFTDYGSYINMSQKDKMLMKLRPRDIDEHNDLQIIEAEPNFNAPIPDDGTFSQ